jgi:hypothetical protein
MHVCMCANMFTVVCVCVCVGGCRPEVSVRYLHFLTYIWRQGLSLNPELANLFSLVTQLVLETPPPPRSLPLPLPLPLPLACWESKWIPCCLVLTWVLGSEPQAAWPVLFPRSHHLISQFSLKENLLFYVYVYAWIYVPHVCTGAHGGQTQAVVRCLMWMLETELGSSARAVTCP